MATMSTVWDRAAEFLSDNLNAVVRIALLALFVPLSLLGALLSLTGSADAGVGLLLSLIVLALAIVTVWGKLAITALALDPAGGRTPAMATATRRLLPQLGASVAVLVLVIVLALPFGIALGLSGLDMTAMAAGRAATVTPDPWAALFIVLYVPVFALLLLWLLARLALVTPVIALERRGAGVFARSFRLTAGFQWKLVGVILLYLIVSSVASLAARTVFGSIFGLVIGTGDGPLDVASVLTSIIVAGVSTIFSLIATAFIARAYVAARDAREAIVDGA